MAAPTTALTTTGVIIATGEASGLLVSGLNSYQNPRVIIGVSGTFTSCVLAVRGRLLGCVQFYPVPAINRVSNAALAASDSQSLTNSTNASFEYDLSGCDQAEVYVVSGTPTTFNVEMRLYPASAPLLAVVNTTVSSAVSNVITASSANGLAVGPNGTTNPTLNVVTNVSSEATGIQVTGAAAAAGCAVAVISSGSNENMTIDAKGSGTVQIGGTSTGNVKLAGGGGIVVLPGTLTAGGLLTCAMQVATSGPLIYSGSGAPSISAAVKGSLYLRSDGSSTSTRAYIASDTAGTWTALTTAA